MSMNTTSTNSTSYVDFLTEGLLEQAKPLLKLNEYAKKEKLPRNVGSKVVDFFRHDKPNSANVQTLTEGTPISTFRTITLTRVQVTLNQIGEAVRISDIYGETSRYDIHQTAIKLLGQDCALKADDISRNEIVINATQKKYSGGFTDFAGLSGATGAPLAYADIISARTSLKQNNVMGWGSGGGDYVMLVPSICYHDLLKDSTIREYVRYVPENERLFEGELGKFANVRLVEINNPFIESATEGVFDSSGNIYSNILLGKDAFGVVDMASQSIFSPKIMVVDKADTSNPLNQYETIGYKAFFNAKLLNAEFVTVIRARTSYV